jgi:hypothetical protein
MPTHLDVEDKLLSIGNLDLTLRQCVIFLVGGVFAYDVWQQLEGLGMEWHRPLVYLRVALTALTAIVAIVVAMTKIEGRVFEDWLWMFLNYHLRSKIYTWRSISPPLQTAEAMATLAKYEKLQKMKAPRKRTKGKEGNALDPAYEALLRELSNEEGE